jgi:integrase
MASLFKRNRHEPFPNGTMVVESRGKRLARWTDDKGKTREAALNSAADRIVLPPAKEDPYYVAYDDENGRRRTVKAYRDKESSEAMGKRLEDTVAKRREGLIDGFDEHRRTPVDQHVDAFFAGQRSKRAPQKKMQINRIIAGTKVSRIHELDTPRIEQFLQTCQKNEEMADRTVNEYIASIKEFTKWAVTNGRLPTDPLLGLRRIGQNAIRLAHPRRALTLEQIARLLDAAERRPLMEMKMIRTGPRRGQLIANLRPHAIAEGQRLGKERRIAYMLAFFGRLRRSEIGALQWGDLHFEAHPAKLKLRAHTTKSKRADVIPLHPQLDDELRAFRPKGVVPNQSVVRTVPSMKALRADLKLAGVEDVDAEGLFADLHGLGKSFITAMAANGVSQRAAMAIARHTDPRLTASVYTDEALLPLAAEIGKVPRLPSLESRAPVNIAAGTSNGDAKHSNSRGRCAGTNGNASATQGTGVAHRSKSGSEDSQTPGKSTKDDGSRAAPAQRNSDFARHSGALHGTNGKGEPPARSDKGDDSEVSLSDGVGTRWHDPAPCGTGSFLEAGEGGRTLDIHVGNVTLYH